MARPQHLGEGGQFGAVERPLVQGQQGLAHGARVFAKACVRGLEADEARCRELTDRSLMLVTALTPRLGYDRAAAVAKEAWATGRTLREIVLEKKWLTAAVLDRALDPRAMTGKRP